MQRRHTIYNLFEGQLKRGEWPKTILLFLHYVFVFIFLYYSPAFLCLFSPTEVAEDGVYQILLDGASPVSLRNLMGNYFFSREDTIWHRTRMFILRAFVLPFPLLGLVMFANYVPKKNIPISKFFVMSFLWHPLVIVYYVCHFIMACYISFFSAGSLSRRNRHCVVCKHIKSKTLICQDNLPERIRNHLHIQPLVFIECSRLFIRILLTCFKRCFLLIPSSPLFLRLFLVIVLLSASPIITIILLVVLTPVPIFTAVVLTSPLFNILVDIMAPELNAYFRHNRYLQLLLRYSFYLIASTAFLGAVGLLIFAGFGASVAITLAFFLLLVEESLPFVACFVLVLYYLWSSYSSFTDKYQDLGLALFKHYKSYKTSRHSQVTDMMLNTNSLPENTRNAVGNKDDLMKIPKELFRMVCEELMPIRESVGVLILKVTLIVSFVFFVFSLIMLFKVSATPAMRAFLTFASGSLPKIVAIYMDGRRRKKIEALTADEKIPFIVLEYIEAISAVNQGQENNGVDVDEIMSQNANEENIELAIV